MLSLLHPGCEKYGGQRCYSVIRLDSSCQRTARRAGNRHNFTRLLCDPVATGPQTPLHLSDEWLEKKAQQTPNKQKHTRTHRATRSKHSVWHGWCSLRGLDKWLLHGVKNSEKADVTLVLFSLASIGSEGRLWNTVFIQCSACEQQTPWLKLFLSAFPTCS